MHHGFLPRDSDIYESQQNTEYHAKKVKYEARMHIKAVNFRKECI